MTHRILFLQETNSSGDDEQKWRDSFGRNSSSVLISYIGMHHFVVSNQKMDNDGRILILDFTINDAIFVLLNFVQC